MYCIYSFITFSLTNWYLCRFASKQAAEDGDVSVDNLTDYPKKLEKICMQLTERLSNIVSTICPYEAQKINYFHRIVNKYRYP